jgi:hypothetical protein
MQVPGGASGDGAGAGALSKDLLSDYLDVKVLNTVEVVVTGPERWNLVVPGGGHDSGTDDLYCESEFDDNGHRAQECSELLEPVKEPSASNLSIAPSIEFEFRPDRFGKLFPGGE